MTDTIENQNPELTDKIGELESLVKKNTGQNRVSVIGDQIIPILTELVSTPDRDKTIEDEIQPNDDYKYDVLAEKVEQKLSSELDDIVNLLKGNLKDSIMNELHDQIKKEPNKKSDE
ncbi:MAG: hypothetical protein ACI9XC_000833 [Gammaproteobacteria bacterium]|jgi:hypothetical protein